MAAGSGRQGQASRAEGDTSLRSIGEGWVKAGATTSYVIVALRDHALEALLDAEEEHDRADDAAEQRDQARRDRDQARRDRDRTLRRVGLRADADDRVL